MTSVCSISSVLRYYRYSRSTIESLTTENVTAPITHVPQSDLLTMLTGLGYFNGTLVSATGFVSHYVNGIDNYDAVMSWEQSFIDNMERYVEDNDDVAMSFMAARSIDDVVMNAVIAEAYLYGIGIVLMFVYLAISLGDWDRLTSRPSLAISGVACVLVGVAGGFGCAAAIGIPMYSMSVFLVLLLLGVGVNQIYLIVSAVDRVGKDFSIECEGSGFKTKTDIDRILEEHFAEAVSQVGVNIVLSTGTSAIAFLSGVGSLIPCIQAFCLDATFCLLFIFFAFAYIFVPLTVFDQRRIYANRSPLLCCWVLKPRRQVQADVEAQAVAKVKPSLYERYCRFITRPVPRAIVLFVFVVITAVSVYAATQIDSELKFQEFLPKGSYPNNFLWTLDEHFSTLGNAFQLVFVGQDSQFDLSSKSAIVRHSLCSIHCLEVYS